MHSCNQLGLVQFQYMVNCRCCILLYVFNHIFEAQYLLETTMYKQTTLNTIHQLLAPTLGMLVSLPIDCIHKLQIYEMLPCKIRLRSHRQ